MTPFFIKYLKTKRKKMKKYLGFTLLIISTYFFSSLSLIGQGVPNPNLNGPYDAAGTGPYYIRVFIKYYEPNNDPNWTDNVDLVARSQGIMDNG